LFFGIEALAISACRLEFPWTTGEPPSFTTTSGSL